MEVHGLGSRGVPVKCSVGDWLPEYRGNMWGSNQLLLFPHGPDGVGEFTEYRTPRSKSPNNETDTSHVGPNKAQSAINRGVNSSTFSSIFFVSITQAYLHDTYACFPPHSAVPPSRRSS